MRAARVVVGAAFVAMGLAAVSCLSATEIVLDVRTDVPCTGSASWHGVAVSVGAPGVDVESRAPVLTTSACGSTGEIGSLVVVPTGSKTAEVGIRVVAGITRNPEDCAANDYDGCIVARRTLSYLAHEAQDVVVDLTGDCIGNACDVNHTCVNGACTDTVVAAPPVAPDGGVVVTGPTVRCGDDGTRCPANDPTNVCCVTFDYDAGTGTGTCGPAAACPSTSAVLYCDDSSDCPEIDAGAAYCVESISVTNDAVGSACVPSMALDTGNHAFCGDRQPCPRTMGLCSPTPGAPGYFTCEL